MWTRCMKFKIISCLVITVSFLHASEKGEQPLSLAEQEAQNFWGLESSPGTAKKGKNTNSRDTAILNLRLKDSILKAASKRKSK